MKKINLTKHKLYAIASVLLMATSLFLAIDMPSFHPVGDYLLKAVGLSPWTGDNTGAHMTVIYFGILFLVSIPLIEKTLIRRYNKSWSSVLIIVAILITIMLKTTTYIVYKIKADSQGLYSIEYISEGNYFEYQISDGLVENFAMVFKLKNHSEEDQYFNIGLEPHWRQDEGQAPIQILNLDGSPAEFFLYGGQRKTYVLTSHSYTYLVGRNKADRRGSGAIEGLILSDKNHKIRLSEHDFFGLELAGY